MHIVEEQSRQKEAKIRELVSVVLIVKRDIGSTRLNQNLQQLETSIQHNNMQDMKSGQMKISTLGGINHVNYYFTEQKVSSRF